MKNPGLPLVDFARERRRVSLVLWNRVYATCSRLRNDFLSSVDSRDGELDVDSLMRMLDRTGNGDVCQDEFLESAKSTFGIRTAHDARHVFRMIVGSSVARYWRKGGKTVADLTRRYPPIDPDANPRI